MVTTLLRSARFWPSIAVGLVTSYNSRSTVLVRTHRTNVR